MNPQAQHCDPNCAHLELIGGDYWCEQIGPLVLLETTGDRPVRRDGCIAVDEPQGREA